MKNFKPKGTFRASKLSPIGGIATPEAGFGLERMKNKLSMNKNPKSSKSFLGSYKNRSSNYN